MQQKKAVRTNCRCPANLFIEFLPVRGVEELYTDTTPKPTARETLHEMQSRSGGIALKQPRNREKNCTNYYAALLPGWSRKVAISDLASDTT